MTLKDKTKGDGREEAVRQLSESGRNWAAIRDSASFDKPPPLFDHPMEITIAMLRGLRMVDETIVVHGDLTSVKEKP